MATTVENTIPSRPPRARLDWPTLLPFAGAVALLGLLTWPTLRGWYGAYVAPDSYYGHAPVIPALMALMFWARRGTLKAVPKSPYLAALAVFVPALALYVFAGRNYAQALMSLSFLLIVWSGVWLALGTRFVRAFWAPLAMLVLMAPLPGPLLNDSTLRIQMASTSLADVLLRAMSFHTVLHGNVIEMDSFPLWVDVPCSGFKLLLSLLTFSAAFAYLVDGTRVRRFALFLVSIPLSLVINSVRIALIGVVGECVGPDAAHVFHDWSGIVTLVLGFAALFSLRKGVRMPHIRRVGYLLMLLVGGALLTSMAWHKPPPSPFVGLKTADVPRRVGPYAAPADYEMPDSVKAALGGADIVSRKYAAGPEQLDFVLLGGQSREALHDPRACLTGAGWLLADQHPERLPQTDVDVQACHAVGLPGAPGYDILYLYVVDGRRISAVDDIRRQMLWNALLGKTNQPVYMLRFLQPLAADPQATAANHAHMLAFAAQMWIALRPKLEGHSAPA